MRRKIGHVSITGVIRLLSGMRIGGSGDVMQIGGTDLICIKDAANNRPYIPGSSIRGKLRSGLEYELGTCFYDRKKDKADPAKPCNCMKPTCPVCLLFGPHMEPDHSLGRSRLIVRDATALDGISTLEYKTENIIDRDRATALHPRTVERVPAGATFSLTCAIQLLEGDDRFLFRGATGADAFVHAIELGMSSIAETGIGSGIGKGYGHVAFENLTWTTDRTMVTIAKATGGA